MISRKPDTWKEKLAQRMKKISEWVHTQLKRLPGEIREVIGGSAHYRMMNGMKIKNYIPDLVTPAYIIKDANRDLPSNSDVKDRFAVGTGEMISFDHDLRITTPPHPFTGAMKSILPILKFKYAEIPAMFFPIPLLPLFNKLFAVSFTALEFFVRSTGALFNWPLHKVRTTLIDKYTSFPVKLFVGVIGGLVSLPFAGISVVVTLAADAISYTRTLLDSFTNLITLPFSYLTKKYKNDTHNYPGVLYTAGTLVKSAMQLIPSALFIAFGITTGGLAFALKPALTVAAKVFIYPLYLGTMAAAAKIFSGVISKGWLALCKKTNYIPRHSRSNASRKDSNSHDQDGQNSKSKNSRELEKAGLRRQLSKGSTGMIMTHILEEDEETIGADAEHKGQTNTSDRIDNTLAGKPEKRTISPKMKDLIDRFSVVYGSPNDVAVSETKNENETGNNNSSTSTVDKTFSKAS
ncbi:MAG: hypothetical protein ABI597_02505 [Gammaproteobacteria bacterium]